MFGCIIATDRLDHSEVNRTSACYWKVIAILTPPPFLFLYTLPFLPTQSLYGGVDDLRDTKADKELLEVEVREVSHASGKKRPVLADAWEFAKIDNLLCCV